MDSVRFLHAITFVFLLEPSLAGEFGEFIGSPRTEWLDGREMILLEDFSFQDTSGQIWKAPKGWKIDGSSIPSVFWGTIVGSPYVGEHRSASVIHDYYCDEENLNRSDKQWKDVHRIYYYASRTAGVGSVKAKLMYWAVYLGGPRWGSTAVSCYKGCHIVDVEQRAAFDAEQVLEVRRWIEEEDPQLSEIEARLDALASVPAPHTGMVEKVEHSKKMLEQLISRERKQQNE